MKIGMLENGMDSIKQGFVNYYKYRTLVENKQATIEDYYVLKRAILNTQHGVEILLKYIIQKKSEFLIIDSIDNDFRKAYLEKIKHNYLSVFSAANASKVHTITYKEAVLRAKDLCNIPFTEETINKLYKLGEYRNSLTHAEIDINNRDIENLFDGLLFDLDVIFLKCIGDDYETLYEYSEIKANYENYIRFYDEEKLPIKKKAFEAFTRAVEKIGDYSIGKGNVIYINDHSIAKVYLKELQKELDFGMDLYNGYCSGKTKIKVKEDGHISIWADDTKDEYIIKYSSMILFIPHYTSNDSPIIILEAADDEVEEENKGFIYGDVLEGKHIDDRDIYDPIKLNEYYIRREYDEAYIESDKNYGIVRFLKHKWIGCFNIQGLKYWNFHELLKLADGKTGQELKNILETFITKYQQ